MRKLFCILLFISSSALFAGSGIDDLANSMGASFSESMHALLSHLRKPFYASELIFLMLYIKNNPKIALGGAGLVAMIYEFAASTLTVA